MMDYLQQNASIDIIPDADGALADLAELANYARDRPELSVEICRLLNDGMLGFDCEVDWSAVSTTGHAVAHYQLPQQLRSVLAALRAGSLTMQKAE